jgi:hypothetical protein
MSGTDAPSAPLAGLSVVESPGAPASLIDCLSDGGRLKACVVDAALVVLRPQPLQVAGNEPLGTETAARNASDVTLHTRPDEEVLRIALADVSSVQVSANGKAITVGSAAAEATMSFSSKWSAQRLAEALLPSSSVAPAPVAVAAAGDDESVLAAAVPRPPLPDLSGVCSELRELQAHRDAVWEEIQRYYNDASLYGLLTQRDHALQCAHQVSRPNVAPAVAVARPPLPSNFAQHIACC